MASCDGVPLASCLPVRRRAARSSRAIAIAPGAARAQTQTPAPPYESSPRRLTFGGEISGILGPRDDDAFFNYTDYERNALRLVRIRLFGEWRLARPLSVVGELRTEAAEDIEAAALFVRWQPWESREFAIQAGRIPPVVGAFARRAYGRDNAVIGLPLAYQYLDLAAARRAAGDDRRRPADAGPRLAAELSHRRADARAGRVADRGVALGHRRRSALAARHRSKPRRAVTRGAPAVPVVRDTPNRRAGRARVAVQMPIGLTVGGSAARGQWIEDDVLALVPAAQRRDRCRRSLGDGRRIRRTGRWLLRGEWIRFGVRGAVRRAAPGAGPALDAWSGFVEARYRLHPRWQVGARVERLDFSRVTRTVESGAADRLGCRRRSGRGRGRLPRDARLRRSRRLAAQLAGRRPRPRRAAIRRCRCSTGSDPRSSLRWLRPAALAVVAGVDALARRRRARRAASAARSSRSIRGRRRGRPRGVRPRRRAARSRRPPPVRRLSRGGAGVTPSTTCSPAARAWISSGQQFVPRVLAITVGTIVDFPNNDTTFHNVFSLAPFQTFDLGRYPPGRTGPCDSIAPGLVPVFCDIHSHMSAYVLVFSHPFFAVTDEAGRYTIAGVPPGAVFARDLERARRARRRGRSSSSRARSSRRRSR